MSLLFKFTEIEIVTCSELCESNLCRYQICVFRCSVSSHSQIHSLNNRTSKLQQQKAPDPDQEKCQGAVCLKEPQKERLQL